MRGKGPLRRGLGLSVSLLLFAMLGLASDISAQEKWKSPFEGEKWGPFRGQIVDLETGQPIPGAVAVVIWWEAVFTPVQTNQKFYEAREAVTDADGRFEVLRLTPPFFGFRIFRPGVMIFAPGYKWEATIVTPPEGEPFVAPTVIQMRRIKTREELRKKDRSRPGGVPLEKLMELTKAVNVERQMLGLKPLPLPTQPEERRQP